MYPCHLVRRGFAVIHHLIQLGEMPEFVSKFFYLEQDVRGGRAYIWDAVVATAKGLPDLSNTMGLAEVPGFKDTVLLQGGSSFVNVALDLLPLVGRNVLFHRVHVESTRSGAV